MLQSTIDAVHKVGNIRKKLQIVPRHNCSMLPALINNPTPWAAGEGFSTEQLGDTPPFHPVLPDPVLCFLPCLAQVPAKHPPYCWVWGPQALSQPLLHVQDKMHLITLLIILLHRFLFASPMCQFCAQARGGINFVHSVNTVNILSRVAVEAWPVLQDFRQKQGYLPDHVAPWRPVPYYSESFSFTVISRPLL